MRNQRAPLLVDRYILQVHHGADRRDHRRHIRLRCRLGEVERSVCLSKSGDSKESAIAKVASIILMRYSCLPDVSVPLSVQQDSPVLKELPKSVE
jgi:hypothetical protein